MFKVATFITILGICSASHAEPPPCLPAAMALSASPLGTPSSTNTYWPTLVSGPIQNGLAVFWHCKVGTAYKVVEVHGTPQAIARAGGLQALRDFYAGNKDAAWEALDAKQHGCIDAKAEPLHLDKRADCRSFLGDDGHTLHYICLNPKITDKSEARLCQHLIGDIALQWPR